MADLWIPIPLALESVAVGAVSNDEAVALLYDALRSGKMTAKASMFFENKSTMPTERQVVLPAYFWDHAESRSLYFNLYFLPPFAEWNGRTSKNGSTAWGISVSRSEVQDLFAGLASAPGKAAGGRPSAINWELCLIEAARLVVVDGLPKTQTDLVNHLLAWCNHSVGATQMKEHVAPFYKIMKSALGG